MGPLTVIERGNGMMGLHEEFRKVAGVLADRRLIDLYSGALSVRQGDGFVVTKSGALMTDLAESDLISCPLSGAIRDDEEIKPVMDALGFYREERDG